MKMLMFVLGLAAAGSSFADQGMNCNPHTAVLYTPGPSWSTLNAVLPSHLVFISAHLGKEMLQGGPFTDAKGLVTGGLMVYGSTDQKAVEAIVNQDPFIKNGVAIPEYKSWLLCTP